MARITVTLSEEAAEQIRHMADAEGKSSSYAAQALEGETVARFWDEEKQPLHQKIGGAVSYAGKQKECSKECGDDLGGVAAGASDRAVEKQLEERQQRLGEVHRFVEEHEDALGKPNMDPAEKQANGIAQLSHLTHVRLELYRRELGPQAWDLPGEAELNLLCETAEHARIANRVIWPALSCLRGEGDASFEELAMVDGWFAELAPALP